MEEEKDVTASGFFMNKLLLSMIGQWPYQSKMERTIIRIIGNSMLTVASFSSFVALYDTRDDFDAIIERIPMCMTGVFYYINFLTLLTHTSKMKALLEDVKKNFKTIKQNSEEEKILLVAAQEGRMIVLFYVVLLGVSTLIYCLVALVPIGMDFIIPLNESRTRNYVYDANYIIFKKEDHYYFVFCHSTIAGIYSVATIAAVDIMLFIFVKHIDGLFMILAHRLKNIFKKYDLHQTLADMDCVEMDSDIISSLKLYDNIIVFSDKVESCFAPCLTFTMGVTAMIMCFQGVMIVARIDEPDFVMRFATNFVAEAIHLFYNCVTGQLLLDCSGSVSDYIYDANWYLLPEKQKKLLMMMLLRSIKDCKVTIGKFFVLNNETFSNLMKTIFSYLSVLMSVRA